jgi:hypothetical protein
VKSGAGRVTHTEAVTHTDANDELENLVAELARRDELTRRERAERWLEFRQLANEFPIHVFGASGGGEESAFLFFDAIASYIDGCFASALVAAHASCERQLAGRVAHVSYRSALPRGWERWGLGRLLEYAKAQDWYSADVQALLEEVNAKRRNFYHYDRMRVDTLFFRTYEQMPWRGKWHIYGDMWKVLRSDALQALRAAFVIRDDPALRDLPQRKG